MRVGDLPPEIGAGEILGAGPTCWGQVKGGCYDRRTVTEV